MVTTATKTVQKGGHLNLILFIKVCMFTNKVYLGQVKTILTDLKGQMVVLLFYVHGKHLRSCRDGQVT